ncbi:MAG: glutamyl-tRNA reductase [Selenomonadaceae bacterium]
MQLIVLGLNHKTAPVEVRERFSIPADKVSRGLKHLEDYEALNEAVILSTCNRSEMYAVVDDAEEDLPTVKQFLFDLTGNEENIDEYLYYYSGEECIRHLFEVASSLDSLVIGEGQILSQVKKAYAIAREEQTTSTVLNTLFHRAIAVGKRVRTETRIAYNAVSVSYAAVELARKILGDLSESNVLLFGAGQMAELTAQHLVDKGVKKVYVANRSFDRAKELAEKFGGEPVVFETAFKQAVDVNVVVTSTGAPHYVVKPWETQQLMTKRKGRPLVFIDIAVPRDVDPDVADIKGVQLYNIDDLEAVVDENLKEREREARYATAIVEEETSSLLDKFRYLSFRPVMALLSDKAERIRCREVKRAMTKLPDITLEERKAMEHMTKMIVRKLLREPMTKLNTSAGTVHEQFYVDAMSNLFKLDMLREQACEEKDDYRYAQQ